jgi:hypothetical protein
VKEVPLWQRINTLIQTFKTSDSGFHEVEVQGLRRDSPG